MKPMISELIWMVDGSRQRIVEIRNKWVLTEDGRKVLKTNLNRQHKTRLLLELQDGVTEYP